MFAGGLTDGYNANMSWDVIGHDWIVETLVRQLAAGELRQAYLFSGPKGVGKRTLALRFAQTILCESDRAAPCLACKPCRQLAARELPDAHWLQAEEAGATLKIEQVRELQRHISLAPYEGLYRFAFIIRAHEMSDEAANALLKTLEEPPPQVILFLTARSPEALLPTLVSRCQVLPVRPVPPRDLVEGLTDRIGPEKAQLVGSLAGGRPGVALSLALDAEALDSRQRDLDDLVAALSGSRIDRFQLVHQMTPGKDRSAERIRVQTALATWLSFWRDMLLTAFGVDRPLVNPDRAAEVERLAGSYSADQVAVGARALQQTLADIDRNANLSLAMEALFLQLPFGR
jgi:DNA polymerase-3 subunit delta'